MMRQRSHMVLTDGRTFISEPAPKSGFARMAKRLRGQSA
jgi:hypothetical protein